MAEPWSAEFATKVRQWCDHVSWLGADALLDAKVISENDLSPAAEIISEELFARLCLYDYPPIPELPTQ
jgi:hypothetical protein